MPFAVSRLSLGCQSALFGLPRFRFGFMRANHCRELFGGAPSRNHRVYGRGEAHAANLLTERFSVACASEGQRTFIPTTSSIPKISCSSSTPRSPMIR